MTNTFKTTMIAMYGAFSLLMLLLSMYKPVYALYFTVALVFSFMFFGFLAGKLTINHYAAVLVPSIILSPIITIPGFFADIRVDDIWLAFGAIVFFANITFKRKMTNIVIPLYAKLYVLFIAWIGITIFLSSFREPYLYTNRDWTEVYKGLKLLAYLLIAVNLNLDANKIKKIINVFLVALLASALFGIMQYFNFVNVNTWLTPNYIFETKIYNLETQRRVVGTFGNPNIFGGALLIGIALSFSNLLSEFKKRYVIMLIVFFVALTMSLSRTALVSAVILIVLMSVMILWKTKKKVPTFLTLSFVPVIALIGMRFAPDSFFVRISRLGDLGTDSSFQARLWMWETIWESRSKINMITGTGPVSNLSITFDNEWLELFTLYGFVGVFLFLLVFGTIYYQLGKVDGNKISFYNVGVKGLMVVFGISMTMLTIYQLLQLMPVIILLMGVVLNKSAYQDDLHTER